MGSVACIRSLGRAGHEVLASSALPSALGFASRYCKRAILVPTGFSTAGYREWLRKLIVDERIDLVLPSESVVTSLGDAIGDFAAWLPAGADPTRLGRFVSKFELFRHFLQAGDPALRQNLPSTLLLERNEYWRERLGELAPPLFAKFDADALGGHDAIVLRLHSCADALTKLEPLLAARGRGLIQAYAPGHGVGVFFLRWGGRILATLMHRRLHEVPHTGGVSSLRETWWDDDLHADALARIESLDWSGVGMLEYRWHDADNSFRLMEFNARFWGSLHLALFAGVDFPELLVDAWRGADVVPVRAPSGIRCRLTFPKEVEYLGSLLRDRNVAMARKLAAVVEAIALSFDPRVHSDLWFPGDTGLYWRAIARTPGQLLRR